VTISVDNNRRAPRSRKLLAAKIVLANGTSVIDCTVRDLSASGARLKIDEVALVPGTFVLLIGSEHRREQCRVVWRRPTDLGVLFE